MQYEKKDLIRLDGARNREIFARATTLDRYERPVETIEGKLTGGSINVDGSSAVRRSFSLSMVAKDLAIHNSYWGLRHKVKLEIGVRNLADGLDSTIYWFKQGIYVLTEFRSQQSVNNFTISMSGKDKMCLLNGEVGGIFTAQTDVGQIETTDDINNNSSEQISLEALKISTIIREMLIGIGGELPQNIILNNVDDYGIEMLTYKGSEPLYIFFNNDNVAIDYNIGYSISDSEWYYEGQLIENLGDYDGEIPSLSVLDDTRDESDYGYVDFTVQKGEGGEDYTVFKVNTNEECGYRITELTYPGGELIANIGESITSVLDKIKNQFGTFEYYYDIDGHFVWQLKPIYSYTSYNTRTDYTLVDTESYVENPYQVPKYSYYFNNNNLLTAISNNPQLGNLKNDFSIWGTNANEVAIHLRYAIDAKPTKYTTYEGEEYIANEIDEDEVAELSGAIEDLKNRRDYLLTLSEEELTEEDREFLASYEEILKQAVDNKSAYYRTHADWRELIYQMALDWFQYYHHCGATDTSTQTADTFIQVLQKNNPDYESLVLYGRTGYEQYYTDIQGFWRYLYNPAGSEDVYDVDGFNKLVKEDPEVAIFDFDFLDADTSDVGNYAIPYIGDRTKTSNNNAIKVIKYREVPNIIYYWDGIDYEQEQVARIRERYYTIWFKPKDMSNYADIAARGKSCYDELDNFLYNYTYLHQSVSLTSIPIYYLEPNTLIYIKDETNDINGEYSINRMTIPLTYNGTMSITANRIPQRLY